MIELSNTEYIRLFRLAFLGRLISGLVHNLNGPLQNLGLDMDMARYSLKDDPDPNGEIIKNIRNRLKRMEEEFDRIDRLIKTSSMKAGRDGDHGNPPMDFNDHLQQELLFLQTNLYFKHNVHTEQFYQDNSPFIHDLSRHSLIALSWFLQLIIEEMENEGIKDLTLKTAFDDSFIKLTIITRHGILPDKFTGLLHQGGPPSDGLKTGDKNVEMMLILFLFREAGILVEAMNETSGSRITIRFPIHHHEY